MVSRRLEEKSAQLSAVQACTDLAFSLVLSLHSHDTPAFDIPQFNIIMNPDNDTLMGAIGGPPDTDEVTQTNDTAVTIAGHIASAELLDPQYNTGGSIADQAERISARTNDLSLAICTLAVGTLNSLYACNQVQEIQNHLREWEINPANMEHPQTVISHLNKFVVWNTGTPFESEVPITAVKDQVDGITLAFEQFQTEELDAW